MGFITRNKDVVEGMNIEHPSSSTSGIQHVKEFSEGIYLPLMSLSSKAYILVREITRYLPMVHHIEVSLALITLYISGKAFLIALSTLHIMPGSNPSFFSRLKLRMVRKLS